MARKVQILLESDLSGATEEQGEIVTVPFSVEGTSYEIDLTEAEATEFYEFLALYREKARRTGSQRGTKKTTKVGPDAKTVKAWADSQGLEYPKRGRLPDDLLAKFEAAN